MSQVVTNTGLGGDYFGTPFTISVAASASNAPLTIPAGKYYISCPAGVSITINNSGTYLPLIAAGTGDILYSDGETGIFAVSNSNSSAANLTLIQIKGSK
ncbi:MAG: hypothetical protein QXI16_03405 [Sulfolobaceae archaeon]